MAQTARYDKGLEEIRQHIQKKNKWTDKKMESIDWVQHGVLQRQHREWTVQVTKQMHKIVPTNAVRQRYKLIPEPTYLLCNSEPETMYHVVQYKQGTRKEWRQQLEQQLTEVGKTQKAPPDIVQAFVHGWVSWTENKEVWTPLGASTGVQTAMTQQNEIGWHYLLHGLAVRAWRKTMTTTQIIQQHGTTPDSNKMAWVTNMLDTIWSD